MNKSELFTEEQQAYIENMQKKNKKEMFEYKILSTIFFSATVVVGTYYLTNLLEEKVEKVLEIITEEIKDTSSENESFLIES